MTLSGLKEQPFLQALRKDIILADGAMGTLLFARGVPAGACLDELNLTDRDLVQQAHLDYILAGATLVTTNTFGANRVRLKKYGLQDKVWDINVWGPKIARNSREIAGEPTWVAGSIGPLGENLQPWGSLRPDIAQAAFVEQAEALLAGGVDLFILETMSDPRELLLAAEAIRSICKLPIVASMTFSHQGETLFGVDVNTVVKELFGDGPPPFDVFGVNCGAGPAPLLEAVQLIGAHNDKPSTFPMAALPNAGLPKRVDGRYVYPSTPDYFADLVPQFVEAGVQMIGGCCGTKPVHTAAMKKSLQALTNRVALADTSVVRPAPSAPIRIVEGSSAADESQKDVRERPSTAAPPIGDGRWQTPWLDGLPLMQRLHEGGVISVEFDPPRGSQTGKYVRDARLLRDAGVDCINVADSPMARVRMSAVAGSLLVAQSTNLSPIIHYTTRDRNLMGIQSDLLGAHALGIRNVLALTGDAPGLGDYAHATAVYDVDSIGLIEILVGLNEGRDIGGNPIGKPTEFTIGAALNLNAETPEELDTETERFKRKLKAGAHFVMTQPVYEAQPYLDMLDRLGGIDVPVLLGIMPLHSLKHAEYLHNEVPGITVPKRIRQDLALAGDDGEQVGLEQAAEVIEATAHLVAGFYVVPSFGRCQGIANLVRRFRKKWGAETATTS